MTAICKTTPIGRKASLEKLVAAGKKLGMEDDPQVVAAKAELKLIADARDFAETRLGEVMIDNQLDRLCRLLEVPRYHRGER